MQTFMDLMIIAAKFLVGIWPLMFITLLFGISRRQKGFGEVIRGSIKGLIIAWGIFAIMRLVFSLMEMETFHLISEPLDTRLFMAVGIMLFPFEIALLLEEKHNRLKANTLEDLRSLSPSEFEEIVAETYRAQGHHVQVVGGTGDHGIDLIVHSHRHEVWLVQCKRYRGKIGEPVVRDFYGALKASDADGGAIITTGSISNAARLWAEGKPIKLYDGEQFLRIVIATRVRKNLPIEATSKHKSTGFIPAPVAVTNGVPVTMEQPLPVAAASRSPVSRLQPAPVAVSHRPASVNRPASAALRTPSANKQPSSILSSTIAFPAMFNRKNRKSESAGSESTASTVTASSNVNEDKHPFMAIDDAPMCPACNVPMILSAEKHLLRKSKQVYICPNAPDCTETYEVED